MEFLATFGLAAKELFDYNRENYSFDAEQRLQRELMRLDMQVTRFEMFREDIRDLVELTVGKMEMYHLVGALFLEKTVALYCEGRIKEEVPPFLLALYYMSVAAGYAYLVLAVWLSMYASICSHSFGVRLLTRFVRLPIPGEAQLDSINARLGDFEQQGAQAMRVPFVGGRQEWKRRQNLGAVPEEEPAGNRQSGASSSSSAAPAPQVRPCGVQEDFLGPGELPLGAMDSIMKASTQLPGKHVHLYRRLQNKWQCYDAYARVSMALGTNNILLAFTFYLVNVTLVQFNAPSAGYSLILVFQFTALALCYIDIAKLGHFGILAMQALPCSSAFIAAISAELTDHASGVGKNPGELTTNYPLAPLCFFLLAAWFEMLLRTAWPSNDGACLPRRFRAVLFLDVFEDAGLTLEEAEGQTGFDGPGAFGRALASGVIGGSGPGPGVIGRSTSDWTASGRPKKPLLTVKLARDADDALFTAHAAVRRWEAVPAGLSDAQRREIAALRREINVWRNALNAEAARRAGKRGIPNAAELLVLDERPWNELSEQEQEEDPHAHTLIGPLQHTDSRGGPSSYYYNVEDSNFVYHVQEGSPTFTLQDVRDYVSVAEEQVRALLGGQHPAGLSSGTGTEDESGTDPEATDEGLHPALPLRMQGGATRRQPAPLGGTYVPPRMPWRILHLITRGLQVAYIFLGFSYLVQNLDAVSYYDVTSYISAHDRRLSSRPVLGESSLEGMPVDFPQGGFFQPLSVSCVAEGTVLVGTRHEMYSATIVADGRPMTWEALAEERFPQAAVAFCEAGAAPKCLMGELVDGGATIAVWRMGGLRSEAAQLRIASERPWRSLAGALARCSEVPALTEAANRTSSCLLLAGFDGARVPVAALEVELGTGGVHTLAEEVVPSYDVRPPRRATPKVFAPAPRTPWRGRAAEVVEAPSCPAPPAPEAVLGLSVGRAASGEPRLWALLGDGSAQVWDIARPALLGRRRFALPGPGPKGAGPPAAAMCAAEAGLHILAYSPASGARWYRGAVTAEDVAGVAAQLGPPPLG